uniref:Ycf4 n=1 Tax=Haramonas pauciplastida TaxID=478668 RepID=UPI0021140A42|nr:Ycf4 [Haramonas pauciplastida]YP_010444195.1 Ycf4 [Haramonas pauciplastida]UTE95017.1 Ycf4 [Haramonas pauciplastida]UTE95081.1 Ycf4 [Haramonas pauciplastida]
MLNINKDVYLEKVAGSKLFSNYVIVSVLSLGGVGFLTTGLSSYFRVSLIPFLKLTELFFIPQGIIITFYGATAVSLSVCISLLILMQWGSGYNEFNKRENIVRIVRKKLFSKEMFLVFNFEDVKCIRLLVSGNNQKALVLCLKDNRQIPISEIDKPISLTKIERKAYDLATFLGVSLEGL